MSEDKAAEAVVAAGLFNQERHGKSVRNGIPQYVQRLVEGVNGKGNRWEQVHKATVCKWINDSRPPLSADRVLRVRQGQQNAKGHAHDGERKTFDPSKDE